MLTIRQTSPGTWELCRGDTVLAVFNHDDDRVAYSQAVTALGTVLAGLNTDERAALATSGVLPETWVSDLCFSAETGDGRNFSECTWTARDPATSVLPIMLQTVTEWGHFGAELAGYIEQIDGLGQGTNPTGRGRFYDSEIGRQFRDMLLGGRRFGVSVDPGAVAVEEECLAIDDDGWCIEYQLNFIEYEIIGVTGTPFPGFANAAVWLDGEPAEAEADDGEGDGEAVAAAAAGGAAAAATDHPDGGPACCASCAASRAPVSTGPAPATRVTDRIATPREAALVASATATDHARRTGAGGVAVQVPLEPPDEWLQNPNLPLPSPLTITREGRVISHVATWGTCHTGHLDRCVTPPRCADYSDFMSGGVITASGARVSTGVLTWGIPHADLSMTLIRAQGHYADSRFGWADVAIGEDAHGVWVSGALRPGLTDEDLRVLRALSLSGDWRHSHRLGALSMIAALAVNYPGFPIPALTAAAAVPVVLPRHRIEHGEVTALVASGMVQPDPDDARLSDHERRLRDVERALSKPHRDRLRQLRREALRGQLAGR